MKKSWIIGGVVALLVIWGISSYNGLASSEENVSGKWAQVQNVYQRRADLIPNFVETVKGGVAAEKDILTSVMNARAKATSVNVDPSKLSPDQINNFQQAQDGLSSALGRLMVVVEKYPELQSIQGFSELRAELAGTENRIAVARMDFNQAVQGYNASIRRFPANLLAGIGGFDKKGYFEADKGAQTAPKVTF